MTRGESGGMTEGGWWVEAKEGEKGEEGDPGLQGELLAGRITGSSMGDM